MKNALLIILFLLGLSSCSVMQKQMMKRMNKMPEEEKIAMMSDMMRNSEDSSCNDMMSKMSKVFMKDSLSKPEMASEMLPICVGGILADVDSAQRSRYLLGLTKEILVEGFETLPEADKVVFKEGLMEVVGGL